MHEFVYQWEVLFNVLGMSVNLSLNRTFAPWWPATDRKICVSSCRVIEKGLLQPSSFLYLHIAIGIQCLYILHSFNHFPHRSLPFFFSKRGRRSVRDEHLRIPTIIARASVGNSALMKGSSLWRIIGNGRSGELLQLMVLRIGDPKLNQKIGYYSKEVTPVKEFSFKEFHRTIISIGRPQLQE